MCTKFGGLLPLNVSLFYMHVLTSKTKMLIFLILVLVNVILLLLVLVLVLVARL